MNPTCPPVFPPDGNPAVVTGCQEPIFGVAKACPTPSTEISGVSTLFQDPHIEGSTASFSPNFDTGNITIPQFLALLPYNLSKLGFSFTLNSLDSSPSLSYPSNATYIATLIVPRIPGLKLDISASVVVSEAVYTGANIQLGVADNNFGSLYYGELDPSTLATPGTYAIPGITNLDLSNPDAYTVLVFAQNYTGGSSFKGVISVNGTLHL